MTTYDLMAAYQAGTRSRYEGPDQLVVPGEPEIIVAHKSRAEASDAMRVQTLTEELEQRRAEVIEARFDDSHGPYRAPDAAPRDDPAAALEIARLAGRWDGLSAPIMNGLYHLEQLEGDIRDTVAGIGRDRASRGDDRPFPLPVEVPSLIQLSAEAVKGEDLIQAEMAAQYILTAELDLLGRAARSQYQGTAPGTAPRIAPEPWEVEAPWKAAWEPARPDPSEWAEVTGSAHTYHGVDTAPVVTPPDPFAGCPPVTSVTHSERQIHR